jgi:hypothetical protein
LDRAGDSRRIESITDSTKETRPMTDQTTAAVGTPDAQTATILENYRRSLDVMDAAIRSADPARWDDQSPCENWTARQVAGHAMTFIRNVVALAGDGAPPDFHSCLIYTTDAADE